ncbi:MAG: hypothetical protein AAGA73_16300 [Pseudomonadota bacterium]
MMKAARPPMMAGINVEQHANQVALLAFRCARHAEGKRDIACAEALKAYLDINPTNENASDEVIAVLVDALRARPHWLN